METTDLDVISAIAAMGALLFALIEAIIKHYGKNADKNTLFYTKYLYICQQLEIGVKSVEKLLELAKVNDISKEMLVGFAKAHMISSDVHKCIFEYQELAYICLKSNIEDVRMALRFGATAVSNAESVNGFFQSVITYEQDAENGGNLLEYLRSQKTRNLFEDMEGALEKLRTVGDVSNDDLFSMDKNLRDIMKDTVRGQRWRSNCIHVIQFVVFFAFLMCCGIHIVYLHTELAYLRMLLG